MRVPAILGLLSLCPLLNAQSPLNAWDIPRESEATETAFDFQRLRLSGRDVRKNVSMLAKELDWKRTLGSAQKAAQQSGKPILWIQALGTLTGYT